MQLSCTCVVCAMHLSCSRHTVVIQLSHSRHAVVIHLKCGCHEAANPFVYMCYTFSTLHVINSYPARCCGHTLVTRVRHTTSQGKFVLLAFRTRKIPKHPVGMCCLLVVKISGKPCLFHAALLTQSLLTRCHCHEACSCSMRFALRTLRCI